MIKPGLIISFVALLFFGNYNANAQFVAKQVKQDGESTFVADKDTYFDLTESLPSGFLKDGSMDYTQYIQNGINSHANVMLPDFPILTTGIRLQDNTKLYFQKKSKLIMKPTEDSFYNIILIEGVSNVKVINPTLIGDRDSHKGKSGEWGYGIYILCASKIEIINATISKCWGDGIVVSDTYKNLKNGKNFGADDIKINGFVLNHNRRNGISILGGKNIDIQNEKIYNTMGIAPKAGIMVEPNNATNKVENLVVTNVVFKNNVLGVGINLNKLSNSSLSNNVSMVFSDLILENSLTGIQIAGFSSKPQKKTINGSIDFRNIKTKNTDIVVKNTNNYNVYPFVQITGLSVFENGSYTDKSKKITKNISSTEKIKIN